MLAAAQAQADAVMQQTGGKGLQVAERTCVICYDSYTGFNDGVACAGGVATARNAPASERHFLCNECFVACVESASGDDFDKQVPVRQSVDAAADATAAALKLCLLSNFVYCGKKEREKGWGGWGVGG